MLSYLQRVGRALMVPVAILPASALLLGIGHAIDSTLWGQGCALAQLCMQSGGSIINNMSLLFAVGVAYGLSSDKDGAAALAGLVGFSVVTTLCSPSTVAALQGIPLDQVDIAFGKINNQFIGILTGILSSVLYNKYSRIELPKVFSFFGGRRLVPILTSALMTLLSLVLLKIWPIIFEFLIVIGSNIQHLGACGAGIYGFFNRLLIPVGLHHALNSVFWFDVAGINDIPDFLAGQTAINAGQAVVGITGRYQAGFFPIMMFGVPGAALAIYHNVNLSCRKAAGGILLASAFVSFFTGITEPFEFSFMFAAPVLYVLHAAWTGLSLFVAAHFHWISGFGFSAGLIDFVLSSRNPLAVHWYMLSLQGLFFFSLYYISFFFTIRHFHLDLFSEVASDQGLATPEVDLSTLAHGYIEVVGGANNFTAIDACITRLRLGVKEASRVDERAAKRLGASGVMRLDDKTVHIVVGTRAELIATAMREALSSFKPK